MLDPEALAGWYFRLNGYLTIPNFVLHGDPSQRTDVDVLGVRFPHRDEFAVGSVDDPALVVEDVPHVIFVEVKRSTATLNTTWDERTISDLLRAVGVVRAEHVPAVAAALCHSGRTEVAGMLLSLVVVGETLDPRIVARYPHATFRSWDEVLQFIFARFSRFARVKADHEQWDRAGMVLWKLATRDLPAFCTAARAAFGLRRH